MGGERGKEAREGGRPWRAREGGRGAYAIYNAKTHDAPTACAEQGEDGGEGLEYVAGKLDDDCGAEGAYQLDQHEQPR